MIIRINEKQYQWLNEAKDIIDEGVDWSKNDNGSINLHINNKKDDNSNKGTNSVDTRVFGTKDEILNGKIKNQDGSENKLSKSLAQNYTAKQTAIAFYNYIINYIENGRQGEIQYLNGLDLKTWNVVNNWFKRGDSDNKILDACKKSLNRINTEVSQIFQTYKRVSQETEEDKVARYITGIVPSTNVKYIALFSMTDFNFSDAIKHGTVRQNGNTDKILGISEKDRPLDDNGNLKQIPVTYDGKITPNIAQNFSQYNVPKDHFKQSYGYNGKGGYNSITTFLDKSVMYADYALKKESFKPDVIVSAPSSSKFKQYYCTNLSNKLGVPYVSDFFQRNMVNVRFDDGKDVSILKEKGFSEKEIFEFASQVKNIAYKEIAYFIGEPISNFVYKNQQIFSQIPLQKNSRTKTPIDFVIQCLTTHAYQTVVSYIKSNDYIGKQLIQLFFKDNFKQRIEKYDDDYLFKQIQSRIGKRYFNLILQQVLTLVEHYSNLLKERGYKLRFGSKRFKITQIKKQFRPFLNNVYIVADNYTNKNGELFTRFKNSKFLIFDEDINSGATLKLAIDALQQKIPENTDNNILCLVNAYSGSGF